MKLNKTMGRIATTLVATAMLASLAAPTYAEDVTTLQKDGYTVKFNKTIDMAAATGATIPTGDFTFNVTIPTTVGNNETKGEVTDITDEGDEEGTQIVVHSDGTSATLTGDITFAENAFNAVGTYVYTLQEVAGTNPDINYHASDVYTLRVTVLNDSSENPDGKTFKIGDVTLQKVGEDDKTATITNEYNTYDLTVSKTVKGNWGVQSDNFTFVVTINKDSVPESVTGITLGDEETPKDLSTLKNDSGDYQIEFTLQGGKSYTIHGLPSTATYKIEELDQYAAANYQTTVKGTGDTEDTNGKVYNADMKDGNNAADISVEYTNTRDPGAATGVVMDIAPYALLVVVAAGACFFFMRKRRED